MSTPEVYLAIPVEKDGSTRKGGMNSILSIGKEQVPDYLKKNAYGQSEWRVFRLEHEVTSASVLTMEV